MSLEEEVTELMRGPVKSFETIQAQGGFWFGTLNRDQRDELFLLSLTGLADAVTRLARAIDQHG